MTLRIVIDGADSPDGGPGRVAAAMVGGGAAPRTAPAPVAAPTPLRTVRDRSGVERFSWARHEAGWFEGAPLGLELVVPAAVPRPALWPLADALIIVIGAGTGSAPLLAQLRSWSAHRDDPPACTLFVEQAAPAAPAPTEATAASAASAAAGAGGAGGPAGRPPPAPGAAGPLRASEGTVPALVVAISADGGGVRYGLAMAVRSAIERLRRRDARGEPRTAALAPEALASLLDGRPPRRPGRVPVPAPPPGRAVALPGGAAGARR